YDSIEELEAFRKSANPQWSQSGISPLVSPMLEFLGQEVEERQTTCDTMNTYMEELGHFKSPDRNEEYDDLIAACKAHEECREEASSTKAVKDMRHWHEQGPNGTDGKYLEYMDDEELEQFLLPLPERNYRESIVRQQSLARATNTWHHSQFPELLDRHQSRTEEIKTLMARLVTEHRYRYVSYWDGRLGSLTSPNSRLLTGLVGQLEATKNSVYEFSSSSFISSAHDQRNFESDHTYMKEAVHVDFSNGTTRPYIVFGTVSQTLISGRHVTKAMVKGLILVCHSSESIGAISNNTTVWVVQDGLFVSSQR
ncbi:14373_t:CDS:2, partial [Acaulospora colombiana]